MSAKYFIPYCIKPTFLHPTEGEAKTCGFVNGLIYSILTSLLVTIAGGRFYFTQENPDVKKQIMYGVIAVLVALWVLVPFFSWYGTGTMWRGYESTIVDLMKQGYTKQQAISFLQGMVDSGPQMGLTQGLSAMVFAKAQSEDEEKPKKKAVVSPTESDNEEKTPTQK